MNSKKAREIRKSARLITVGMPYREYRQVPNSGAAPNRAQFRTALTTTCTRHVIKQLKKAA